MNQEALQKAVDMAGRLKHVLLLTVDREGMPHLAAAENLTLISNERIKVSGWFCPKTVTNLQSRDRISLVVWDQEKDTGFQLLGRAGEPREMAVLDGYMPEESNRAPIPQINREVEIKVARILSFRHGPHNDVEIE